MNGFLCSYSAGIFSYFQWYKRWSSHIVNDKTPYFEVLMSLYCFLLDLFIIIGLFAYPVFKWIYTCGICTIYAYWWYGRTTWWFCVRLWAAALLLFGFGSGGCASTKSTIIYKPKAFIRNSESTHCDDAAHKFALVFRLA